MGQPFINADGAEDALLPVVVVQIVGSVEEGIEFVSPEVGDGLTGAGFHFHADAACGLARFHVPFGLPEEGVGGPGLTLDVGDVQPIENGGHSFMVFDVDKISGWGVVVAHALIPIGIGGNDELTGGQLFIQSAAGAKENDLLTGKCVAQILHQSAGHGCSHIGLRHADIGALEDIDGEAAGDAFEAAIVDEFQQILFQEGVHDFVGEIKDAGVQLAVVRGKKIPGIDLRSGCGVKGCFNTHGEYLLWKNFEPF